MGSENPCDGFGFYMANVPSYEDYSPHGGFWADNPVEVPCGCDLCGNVQLAETEQMKAASADEALTAK